MSKLVFKNEDGTWTTEAKELFLVEKILKAIGTDNFTSEEKLVVTLEDKYAYAWANFLADYKMNKAIKSASIDRFNQLLQGYNALQTCKISLVPKDFLTKAVKKHWQGYLISRLYEKPAKPDTLRSELRNAHGTDERLAVNDKYRQELIQPSTPNVEMIAPEDRVSADFPQDIEFVSTSAPDVEYRI